MRLFRTSLGSWKYFGQLSMMMLLLLFSYLDYPSHLFLFLPTISFLTSTLFTQKKVTSRVAHFYVVLENAEGGGRKSCDCWQCGFTERAWAPESDRLGFKSGSVTHNLSNCSEVQALTCKTV